MAPQPTQGSGGGDSEMIWLILAVVVIMVFFWLTDLWSRQINLLFAGLCWPILDLFAGMGRIADGVAAAIGMPGARAPFVDALWRSPLQIIDALAIRDVGALTPAQRAEMIKVATLRLGMFLSIGFAMLAMRAETWHVDENRRALNSLPEQIQRQTERHKASRHMRRRRKLLETPDVDRVYLNAAALAADEEMTKVGDIGALTPLRAPIAPPTPWASALKPEEWLIAMGITSSYQPADNRDQLMTAIESALADQMTQVWRGFAALTPTRRALAAAFCSYYGFDRDRGEALLNDLATLFSVAPETANAQGVPVVDMNKAIEAEDGLLKRIDAMFETSAAKEMEKTLFESHAFEETAFYAMLTMARSTQEDLVTEMAAADSGKKYSGRGLLPTAQFVWLKEFDRAFYLTLNTVGSNTPCVEAAGVMAHYLAERAFRIPLEIPTVWQAARAIVDDYLDLSPERVEKKRKSASMRRSLADEFDAERASHAIEMNGGGA